MKVRGWVRVVGLCLLAALAVAARAESLEAYWAGFFDYYYHATRNCALAGTVSPVTRADAEAQGKWPCPTCVSPGEASDGKVRAVVRGGTVVLRVPDSWMDERLAEEDAQAAGERVWIRSYTGETARLALAAQLHDGDYVAFADHLAATGAAKTGENVAAPAEPDVEAGADGLVMNRRHIGSDWYITFRPGKDGRKRLDKKGRLDVRLAVERHQLEMVGGALDVYLDGQWADEDYTVKPKKSKERPDSLKGEGLEIALFRELDAYIAVIYADGGSDDPTERVPLLIDGVDHGVWMNGYVDGDRRVFCAVLTAGEWNALSSGAAPSLGAPAPAGTDFASATSAAPEAVPEEEALPSGDDGEAIGGEGVAYRLARDAWPEGAAYIEVTLRSSGIRYYNLPGDIQRQEGLEWTPVADAWHYCERSTERYRGYVAGALSAVMPLNGAPTLTAGHYRVCVERLDLGSGDQEIWLAFDVTGDAPPLDERTPGLTAIDGESAEAVPDLPADHAPAWQVAPDYHSCLDDDRYHHPGDGRTLVKAGDVVYELRGAYMDDWDWFTTRYWLAFYPAGEPERAAMALRDIDLSTCELYDAGDGLLIWCDPEGRFYRVNYDGTDLEPLDVPGNGERATSVLPAGEYYYFCNAAGVWRERLDGGGAEKVYAASDSVRNGASGARMVYADGRLYVADDGIVAIDVETLDARVLTDEYDPASGDCGLGYIVMGGELYTWSPSLERTVAIDLATGEVREVSKTRFYFSQACPDGTVLALTGKNEEGLFGGYDAASFYLAADAEHPSFDPDHCRTRPIERRDFLLGGTLYHTDADGRETATPWTRG